MTPRTSPEVGGMGHAVKRKEDPRFIRGQGTYVDDIELPGMLYLDIVRSPYAHATIKNIDASKALAIPGVLDVITGATLAKHNLHWMPTLMSDMPPSRTLMPPRRWHCPGSWTSSPALPLPSIICTGCRP